VGRGEAIKVKGYVDKCKYYRKFILGEEYEKKLY